MFSQSTSALSEPQIPCFGALRSRSARPTYASRVVASRVDVGAAAPHPGMEDRVQDETKAGDAEGDDGVAAPGVGRVQHERGQDRRPCPQDEHATALAVAEAHQPVMEMLLVGSGRVRPPRGPPRDRERGVEDWDSEDEERDDEWREEEERL